MRYLLDTNVITELRKPAQRASDSVQRWAKHQATSDLGISVLTAMEIEIWVSRVERRDHRQGASLRKWLEEDLLAAFAGHILPIDLAVVRNAAAMHVPDPRLERDALIAATALSRNLVVVTRNTADFNSLGARLLNPWDQASA